MDENTGGSSVAYAPPNVGKRLIHVRGFMKRHVHEVAEQVDGVLRVFRGFLGLGIRRPANHALHDNFAKLQCRREKFRRTRKLGVYDTNEPAACFGHDGLIESIQRVQSAIRVVFTENPQFKCRCQLGLDALEQPQGRHREFFKLLLGQRRRPRKHCGESAKAFRFSACCFCSVREKSQKVRVGRVSARIANLRFLRLSCLRLFEVLLVGNLRGCSKTDDLLHVHRRRLP